MSDKKYENLTCLDGLLHLVETAGPVRHVIEAVDLRLQCTAVTGHARSRHEATMKNTPISLTQGSGLAHSQSGIKLGSRARMRHLHAVCLGCAVLGERVVAAGRMHCGTIRGHRRCRGGDASDRAGAQGIHIQQVLTRNCNAPMRSCLKIA